MDLEKKIKWTKRAAIASFSIAVLGIGYMSYQGLKKGPSTTPIIEAYENIKQRIENIEENSPSLKENTYVVEDPLLKKFSEQQLELDNLTKNRFEKHLSRIERDPEFIEDNYQFKEEELKRNRNDIYGGAAILLGILGAFFSSIKYKKLYIEEK